LAFVAAPRAQPARTLVFDFGGVVFRWQPEEFLPRLLPQHASDPAAAHRLAARLFEGFGGDWADFDRGRIEPAPLAERIAARTGLALSDARKVIDAIPDELQPVPKVEALLRRLQRAGHRLFFLSNMPAPYARHLESSHALFEVFENGVFSSRVGLIKPEPALFAHAADVFGCDPRTLLLIDDSRLNVDGAARAGWGGLRFENAEQCADAIVSLGYL